VDLRGGYAASHDDATSEVSLEPRADRHRSQGQAKPIGGVQERPELRLAGCRAAVQEAIEGAVEAFGGSSIGPRSLGATVMDRGVVGHGGSFGEWAAEVRLVMVRNTGESVLLHAGELRPGDQGLS
jgi:hypothetical protein